MLALVLSLVPLGALVALGGAYSTATIPLLVASAGAFLLSRARIAATPETRALDLALLACMGVIVLQAMPLPAVLVAGLSPHSADFESMLAVRALGDLDRPAAALRPLTIDARATREGLATALSSLLVFWAARETFTRDGGVRVFARAVAWSGFVVALVALVQRATAPTLLLWTWKPLDPGAQPYGPFVNRNHFATWLLMASALTVGYLVTHLRAHGFERHRSTRLLVRDLLADGSVLLLAGCTGAMLLALVGSLSRAALLGLAAAVVFALTRARRVRGRTVSIALAGALMLAIFLAAAWANRDALIGRLETVDAGSGRLTIWRETMPIVTDFWLAGTGIGTYGTAMLRYQVTRTDRLFNQAHNEYLQLLAEGGLLLAAAAAAAAWAWLRMARRRLAGRSHGLHWIRLGAAAGICAIVVQSIFEAGLRMPANALLLAMLAAIVTCRDRIGADGASGSLRAQPPWHTAEQAAYIQPG